VLLLGIMFEGFIPIH